MTHTRVPPILPAVLGSQVLAQRGISPYFLSASKEEVTAHVQA